MNSILDLEYGYWCRFYHVFDECYNDYCPVIAMWKSTVNILLNVQLVFYRMVWTDMNEVKIRHYKGTWLHDACVHAAVFIFEFHLDIVFSYSSSDVFRCCSGFKCHLCHMCVGRTSIHDWCVVGGLTAARRMSCGMAEVWHWLGCKDKSCHFEMVEDFSVTSW